MAAPALALAAATLAVLAAAAVGVHPLWPATVANASEAISTGDEAGFVRLVMAGADPNARAIVRAGLRESVDVPMTPLEVAVDMGSEQALETVLAHGAVVNGSTARTVVCIAHRRAPHLLPILKARGAPDVDPGTCPQGLSDQIELLRSLQ